MKNISKNSLLPGTLQEKIAYKVLGFEMFSLYKELDRVRNNGGGKKSKEKKEKEICNEIAKRNQSLVVKIACQINGCFRDKAIGFEDIMQEGRIGLLAGTKRFDFRRGYKYSSYVSWWVRQSITKFLIESGGTIIRPSHMHENVRKLNQAEQIFRNENNKDIADEKLANLLGWDLGKLMVVQDVRQLGQEMYSLDDFVYNGGERSSIFLDRIIAKNSDGEETNVEEEVFGRQLVNRVNEVLSECGLSKREKDVINRRFTEENKLQQIADDYGLSRERIRQIQRKVLNRLRRRKYLDKLRQIDPDAYPEKILIEESERVFPEKSEEVLEKFPEFIKHLKEMDFGSMSPRAVLIHVAEFFGFTFRRIVGTRQNSALHLTRSIIAYTINNHKKMECKEIGILLGHRTYNTTYAWLKEGEKIFKKNKKPRK